MPNTDVLDALLDSWDRNNTITVNLLRALPEGSLGLRAVRGRGDRAGDLGRVDGQDVNRAQKGVSS